MGLPIKAVQKLSLVDYPGRLCSVIFLGGCNFRCGYCYNVDLVLHPEKIPSISEGEVLDLLAERFGLVDGVCLTGGEPALHGGIFDFVQKVKDIGYSIKIDTNGSRPEILRHLTRKGLVDYVAMDVKAPLERYAEVAGVEVDPRAIEKSIDLIRGADADYEFRTTVLPTIVTRKEILGIARYLRGAKRYFLQQFEPKNAIDPNLKDCQRFTVDELNSIRQECNAYLPTSVRI